jgi:hypothetical protein
MFTWLNKRGFQADIPALRRDYPEIALTSLEKWLRIEGWGETQDHGQTRQHGPPDPRRLNKSPAEPDGLPIPDCAGRAEGGSSTDGP